MCDTGFTLRNDCTYYPTPYARSKKRMYPPFTAENLTSKKVNEKNESISSSKLRIVHNYMILISIYCTVTVASYCDVDI